METGKVAADSADGSEDPPSRSIPKHHRIGGHCRRKARTSPLLSKYEFARIVGTRSLQLSIQASAGGRRESTAICGDGGGGGVVYSNPLVNTGDTKDWTEIAEMELLAGRLDNLLIVRRHLENGAFEDWPLHQLIIRSDMVGEFSRRALADSDNSVQPRRF